MTDELDVLRIIGERLDAAGVPFMLTGSFALGYYGKPRMTRDLDFVVTLMERDVDANVQSHAVDMAGVPTWIASREDLILSKLVWARDSGSELQMRDVRTLLDDSVDWPYLKEWAPTLGVTALLDEVTG